jgi:PKD repeat protein
MSRIAVVAAGATLALIIGSCGDDDSTKPSTVLSLTCAADPTSGSTPLDVVFSASAKGGSGDVHYVWAFGDGSGAVGPTVSRRFDVGGTYDVSVTAHAGAETATCNRTVVIQSPLKIDYCVPFPESGFAPLDIELVTHAYGSVGDLSYEWDFGDGNVSSERQPRHTYRATGEWPIRLVVRGGGSSAMCTSTIDIFGELGASCEAFPQGGSAPLTVKFTSNASGGNGSNTYLWTFGDGNSSTKRNPTYTYEAGGTYKAYLRVTSAGSTASCRRTITVQ